MRRPSFGRYLSLPTDTRLGAEVGGFEEQVDDKLAPHHEEDPELEKRKTFQGGQVTKVEVVLTVATSADRSLMQYSLRSAYP